MFSVSSLDSQGVRKFAESRGGLDSQARRLLPDLVKAAAYGDVLVSSIGQISSGLTRSRGRNLSTLSRSNDTITVWGIQPVEPTSISIAILT